MSKLSLVRILLLLVLIFLPALACRALISSPTDLSGNWVGTYFCNQGLTNLNLVLTENSPSDVSAVFNFFANSTNPSVPSGSYKMAGTYDNSTRQLMLKGMQWINQPAGYFMVGLTGTVSQDNTQISGSVIGTNCSTFTLTKQ